MPMKWACGGKVVALIAGERWWFRGIIYFAEFYIGLKLGVWLKMLDENALQKVFL